jgi:uncharacterized protein (TIRG00374 family)
MTPGRRKALQIGLGLTVSGALLTVVLAQLDAAEAWARVTAAHWGWLGAAVLVSFAVLCARGLRFTLLLDRPSVRTVTAAVAAQNFLLRVTPLRVGELSLPYLLHKSDGEPMARSLLALLLVRLVDLWVLVVAAAAAGVAWFGGGDTTRTAALLAAAAALGLVLWAFRWWLELGLRVARRVADALGLLGVGVVEKIFTHLDDALRDSDRLSRRQWLSLAATTLSVAALQYVLFWSLLRALGSDLSWLQVVVGSSAAQVAGALPVTTVGSIGTHETGWVAGFMWVGVPLSEAALTGVATQVVTLVFAALFAGPAWWYYNRRLG